MPESPQNYDHNKPQRLLPPLMELAFGNPEKGITAKTG
jgi:hypothetical protein